MTTSPLTLSVLISALSLLTQTGSYADSMLHVLWMAPRQPVMNGHSPAFSAATSAASLVLAMEKVRREGLLGHMTINVTWLNSACDAKLSLGRAVQFMVHRGKPDVIMGPPCTVAMVPVADLVSFFNIPVFGWVSNEHVLDNKTRASTLVRTMPPISGLGTLLLEVCDALDWYLIAIISTNDGSTRGIADFLKDTLENSSDFFLARHFSHVNISLSYDDVRAMMSVLKTEARVIFLIIPNDLLRHYLLAAHDEGMTSGDFQFLFTRQTLATEDFVFELRSDAMWKRNDTRDDDARQAYRNLLYLTFSFILEWKAEPFDEREAFHSAFDDDSSVPDSEDRDLYSRFLHDAFYLYCLAYNATVTSSLTPDGHNIFQAATRQQFQGLTGTVTIDKNGDRLPSFLIWDMAPDDTFRIVYNISYTINSTGHEVVTMEKSAAGIYWGNGKSQVEDNYIPPDRPACGFHNEYCPPDTTVQIVVPIVLFIMLAGVLVFFILYKWWKKEQELYRRNWRVKWSQLNFSDTKSHGISSIFDPKITGSHSTLSDCSEHSVSAGNMSGNSSLLSREGGQLQSRYYKTAQLGGNRVALRMIRKKTIRDDRKLLEDMRVMTTLKHNNLTTFHGVCVEPPNFCVLWDYCQKGSIQDLFNASRMSDYKLDTMFQFSIALDICSGLTYLHSSELKVHGNLTSANCLVDSRWTCKLSGFGLTYLLKGEQPDPAEDEQKRYSKLLWTAPEALRAKEKGGKYVPIQSADIYSTAIILKEILCKNEAYEEEVHLKGMTYKEIISKLSAPQGDTLFRPSISNPPDDPPGVAYSSVRLIHACWQEDPTLRPSARSLLRHVKKLNPFKTTNIMDNMISMMERYSSRLEELVAERTSQLEDEKRKTDALLYRMLPLKVAEDLKSGNHVQAEAFTSVTIYFSDIVGFTQIASESTPMQIVEFLNSLYTVFDDVIQEFDVYKVETIGDAYMIVSGIPVPNGRRHVFIMADTALALLQAVFDFVIPHMPDTQLHIRIGLNTGPVVAGVVGNIMPRYCLFGDTVNLASRMESQGLPLRIHLSPNTYDVIKEKAEYLVAERGEINVKGKGNMKTYFLEGRQELETDPQADMTKEQPEVRNPSRTDFHHPSEKSPLPGEDNSLCDT